MGNKVEILGLTTNNLPAFGEVLHQQFLTNYKDLWKPADYTSPDTWKLVRSAIDSVFAMVGLESYSTLSDKYAPPFRVADIVDLANGRTYLITAYTDQYIRTFPSYSSDDAPAFEPNMVGTAARIRRPSLSKIDDSKFQSLVAETLPKEILEDKNEFGGYFKHVPLPEDSTHLQIGDLIFNVDPIQISFVTQNGFQYYPTLRTNGNPKLPTPDQVKNMNIVLMFPNQDAINYQLIPLYAMFRRTPFVNIRNRDIVKFYSEIKSPEGYIPVALESIQIQSVEGFPNSLQATITLLPFEPGFVGNGALRALKSFDDVLLQQQTLTNDAVLDNMLRVADSKMQDETTSVSNSRFQGLTRVVTDHTENFRESFPFRAFYQSLIAENKVVRNEDGSTAQLFGAEENTKTLSSDISFLAPINRENLLHYYTVDGNQSPIRLEYKSIFLKDKAGNEITDLREIGKYLSAERLNQDSERLDFLRRTFDKIKDWKGLANATFTAFHDMKDALRTFEYQFGRVENLINEVLVMHGWNATMIRAQDLSGLGPLIKDTSPGIILNFIYRSILHSTNIAQISSTLQSLANLNEASYDQVANDRWALIGKHLTVNELNNGEISQYGIHTVEGAFKSLWDWVKDDPKKRQDLILIFEEIAEGIKGELTDSVVVVDASDSVENSVYSVKRLPIKNEVIEIDNIYDVVTGWSLTYANKFVPINLIAYKYPFYQHIGSEDATLSLSITSVPSPIKNDLKTKLSKLSDTLYDNVKIISYTSPDLYSWLDPRVKVTVEPGNIFHCFGIHHVILNSSNTTNIQGQPDSWNTVVNLTQANFTVDQYHQIDSIPSLSNLELILANLIPRIVKDSSGMYHVRKFANKDGTSFSLEDTLFLSFLASDYGKQWRKNFQTMIYSGDKMTGGELVNQFSTKLKEITGINLDQYDEGASGALNSLAQNNRKFDSLLTAILKEYDLLLSRQAEVYSNFINLEKSTFQKIWSGVESNLVTGVAAMGADLVLVSAIAMIPVVGQIAAGIVGAGILIGVGASVVLDITKEFAAAGLKNKFGSILDRMINIYKKDMLLQLSHSIMKDPPIRKRLFSPDIISVVIPPQIVGDQKVAVDVEKLIQENETFNRVNCYKDFDVPLSWTLNGRTYRASPDFYLYNHNDPEYYAQTYVRDSTERLLKVGRMGVQLSLIEHKDLLARYDNLLKQLNEASNPNLESVITSVGEELGYTNTLQDSQLKIAQLYRMSVYEESEIKTTQSNELAEQVNQNKSEQVAKGLVAEFERINANLKNRDPKLYKEQLAAFEYFVKQGVSPKIEAKDMLKMNMVWTARMKCLIEIMEMSTAIQQYFIQKEIAKGRDVQNSKKEAELYKKARIENADELLIGADSKKISELNDTIQLILNSWNSITTDTFNSDKAYSKIKERYNKGLYATPIDEDKLGLPSIRLLESQLYNKIGYYIRLNSAIMQYNSGARSSVGQAPSVSLADLPELAMLDVWNVRNTEATFRQLEIERQFMDSINRQKEQTLKFFPTFKLYFIEEDTGRSNLLDDYYAYNAIQSIEISKSKGSSSWVAVLRLSNLIGTITDQLSFHRERSDWLSQSDPFTQDEAFFGTLDIKPGTKVQIKMGYAADDRYLPTVFTGRILEMNVGPVTEIICQSFGAQLQHKVYSHKFGFFASEKEFGDIASALLDMIPGLENLGKKEVINFGLLSGFTGNQLKKVRSNLFDNFLLTNLLGRVTADLKATDNPRDENIYLPFNLSLYADWKPRFDWVVYNQTIWNAIQEICLYGMNVEPVIKLYNNDPISSRNEQRETLVIGNKSGYYKFTDSLSLSSIDIDKIDQRVDEFGKLKGQLNNQYLVKEANGWLSKIFKWEPSLSDIRDHGKDTKSLNVFFHNIEARRTGIIAPDYILFNLNLKPEWKDFWKFLDDQLNVNIIKKRLIQAIELNINSAVDFAGQALERTSSLFTARNWHCSRCVTELDKFVGSISVGDPLATNLYNSDKAERFMRIIYHMTALQVRDPKFWDLSSDEFYGVKAPVNNVNPALASDPRYRKIQQHHLVSDSINLISNNIALNSNFANMVNLYYLDEPQFISSIEGVPEEKWEKLSVWSIKAFGDIRDEHIRPLNTFEKNIDPYWMDIRDKHEGFFKGYSRLNYRSLSGSKKEGKTEDASRTNSFAQYIQKVDNAKLAAFNLHTPDWRFFPSFQVVGVNLLKKEVSQMYRGAIQIVGDCSIEPLDIIHLEDNINDMHGVVEVDEVVHTFTPDGGLVTTITPALITYDRDPIQQEDVGVINRIFSIAEQKRNVSWYKFGIGAGLTILGAYGMRGGQVTLGAGAVGAGVYTGYSGLKSILGAGYHKFLYEQMGNIIGRDVINFTTLLYHGQPFICGFDGVDYTSLKTLMMHRAENIDNVVTRISAFSDEFAASIYTNFNPADFSSAQALMNGAGVLNWLTGFPTHGRLNDAFSIWDRLFGG